MTARRGLSDNVTDPEGRGWLQKKVLIIDDDDDIREVAEIALTAVGGWQVAAASNGGDGITLARQESPDFILLDLMMPGMDGPRHSCSTSKTAGESGSTGDLHDRQDPKVMSVSCCSRLVRPA